MTSPSAGPSPTPGGFSDPIRATLADLSPAVAEAIRATRALPEDGSRRTVETSGRRYSTLWWGPADGRPVVLLHGVLSSARTLWRVGPALGATGRRVVAVDLPGHGLTGGGEDGVGFRFVESAADVAAFVRVALPDAPAGALWR